MSLRRRLTMAGGVLVALALFAFAGTTQAVTQASLRDRTDQELASLASGLMSFAQQQAGRLASGEKPLQYRRLENLQLPESFEGFAAVVAPGGQTAPLPRLARESADLPVIPTDLSRLANGGVFSVEGPKGTDYRGRAVTVPGTESVMFVAVSTATMDATLRTLLVTELIVGATLLMLFLALTAWSVRIVLRPLEDVTGLATRIAAGSTGERATPGSRTTEIGRLKSALNEMLATIERTVAERTEAQERTERFAADAAHELRTPVTVILGYSELYQQGGVRGTERLDEVFARIGHEAVRLRDLVEVLLVLDRLDRDPSRTIPATADAAALGRGAVADGLAIDAAFPVHLAGEDLVLVRAAPDHVAQIFANLLANVRAHTPPGTATTVTLGNEGDEAVIEVADDGPGMSDESLSRAFDRFYRADPSRRRSVASGGSGLGLAIVRAAAEDSGGSATVTRGERGGTVVRVRLPLSSGPVTAGPVAPAPSPP